MKQSKAETGNKTLGETVNSSATPCVARLFCGHLGHADAWHILKAPEYELFFFEAEKVIKTGQNPGNKNIILTV